MVIELKTCPWRKTRIKPPRVELQILVNFLDQFPKESMLEIGGGNSTWYLHQLGFPVYTVVETWEPVVKDILAQNFKDLTLVKRWEDIPRIKYQYIFIDSHVGGNASKMQREKSLAYAIDNNLLRDEVMIIAHDYSLMKDLKDVVYSKRRCVGYDWYKIMEKNRFEVILEIPTEGKLQFGVYQRKQ